MRAHLVLPAALLLLLAGVCSAGEQDRPAASPLRLVPAEADFLIQVRDPARVADLARKLELLAKLADLTFVKDQLDSTSVRRALQLLAYFEKNLGDRWPGLLKKVAGGGIALAGKAGDNAPAVLVIQGTDEKAVKQFVELGVQLLEAELARQESKDKVRKKSEKGVDAYQVGDGLFAARVGAAIVFSNNKKALGRSVALHLGKEKKSLAAHPLVAEAARLLPDRPLADAWLHLEPLKKSDEAKALYRSPRDNPALTVLFGGTLDVLGRSPFVCAALTHDKEGYGLTVRAPRGREGMGPDRDLHVAPKEGVRPLLEPKGVLYSSSFHLDVAKIWTDRTKLFTRANADNLMALDKNSGRFLLGTKVSHLLEAAGANHRFVVANQSKPGYRRSPKVPVPAFGFVAELRKPERFARTADLALRVGALALTNQLHLELKEEKYKGVEVVAYRFDEKKELADDTNDVRYGFSPCWARVGKQFILCSTVELCRELIDLVRAEEKSGKARLANPMDRYYSSGLADLLAGVEDQLITQAILGQAIEPAEAKKQVRQLIKVVRGLGDVTSRAEYREKEWRYEFRFGK